MAAVFLVMATASGFRSSERQPIPLKVFNDRVRAVKWLNVLIDYHISPPEPPYVGDSDEAWNAHQVQLRAWHAGHPAGVAASHYQHFGVYEVILEQ
ncbi:hypothetical protein [Pseudomonas viridiflava]|uniref:hypothetical protein n=1 Tax=Pseudomonas viridiflava TaxID=33069 RepID=UPI000F055333|nr:hypothetical protein [Pseudomonas viridiflava]